MAWIERAQIQRGLDREGSNTVRLGERGLKYSVAGVSKTQLERGWSEYGGANKSMLRE